MELVITYLPTITTSIKSLPSNHPGFLTFLVTCLSSNQKLKKPDWQEVPVSRTALDMHEPYNFCCSCMSEWKISICCNRLTSWNVISAALHHSIRIALWVQCCKRPGSTNPIFMQIRVARYSIWNQIIRLNLNETFLIKLKLTNKKNISWIYAIYRRSTPVHRGVNLEIKRDFQNSKITRCPRLMNTRKKKYYSQHFNISAYVAIVCPESNRGILLVF